MANFGINSPPKPRRHVLSFHGVAEGSLMKSHGIADSMTQQNPGNNDMVGDFEGQLVDRAVTDLPNVFSEVFSMQKGQKNEIQKQQKLLECLKERLSEGLEKKTEIEQEISCVTNKIYMMEETIKDSNKTIKQLDSEIQVLVTQVQDKELHVGHVAEETDAEMRKLAQHKDRMVKFSKVVSEYETSTSSTYNKLQAVTESVRILSMQQEALDKDQEETDRVLTGLTEKGLQSDIYDIKTQLVEAGSESKLNIRKMSEESQRQRQISQTVQVLQKRNTAQMTRLKRQVKDLQLRNRQRQAQVNQLHEKILQASKQLEQ